MERQVVLHESASTETQRPEDIPAAEDTAAAEDFAHDDIGPEANVEPEHVP